MEDKDSRYGKEFEELLFNIRQTMQIVQAQFEVMKSAIDKCSHIDPENYIGCVDALNNAHREILRFLELNIKLVRLIDEFRTQVIAKHL